MPKNQTNQPLDQMKSTTPSSKTPDNIPEIYTTVSRFLATSLPYRSKLQKIKIPQTLPVIDL